jgi:hypothetical protein
MFNWLKQKSEEKQRANIGRTLAKLIPLANEVDAQIQNRKGPTPQQEHQIHKLQESLLLDFIGPMELEDIKSQILDPALQRLGMTKGARIAIEHVYSTALQNRRRK